MRNASRTALAGTARSSRPKFTLGTASSADSGGAGLLAINETGKTRWRLRFTQSQAVTASLFRPGWGKRQAHRRLHAIDAGFRGGAAGLVLG